MKKSNFQLLALVMEKYDDQKQFDFFHPAGSSPSFSFPRHFLSHPLGLFVNPRKCELSSLADRSKFPIEMKRSNVPHLDNQKVEIATIIICSTLKSNCSIRIGLWRNICNCIYTKDAQIRTHARLIRYIDTVASKISREGAF